MKNLLDYKLTLAQFEGMTDKLDHISLIEVFLDKRYVSGAIATYETPERIVRIHWARDGKCYENLTLKHLMQYDIVNLLQ